MAADTIEGVIFDYLRDKYPEGPLWQEPTFHCFECEPLEIRMMPAFLAIEYNVGNGGWSQVLWNCFAHWRVVVEIAEEGYKLTHAKPQYEALPRLRQLLEENEEECREYMQRADREDDFSYFGKFTSRSYGASDTDWEKVYYSTSGVIEQREAWLSSNESRIRSCLPQRSLLSRIFAKLRWGTFG